MAFNFNFDNRILFDLRGAINENEFLTENKIDKYDKIDYRPNGRVYAAMDRLDDTLKYINTLTLGKVQGSVAFDFYEYVNCLYVMIESIKSIANIFEADYSTIELSNQSFKINNCSDSAWFSYVRSLCSVHPTDTSGKRHNPIMQNIVTECCARVEWNFSNFLGEGDLCAIIYSSPKANTNSNHLPEYEHKHIFLTISMFNDYLQHWLDFIPNIILAIKNYNNKKYAEFRNIKIKSLEQCKNEVEQLALLKEEYNRRFGNDFDDTFDYFIEVFTFTLSNSANNKVFNLYKNAIRYSLPFLFNGLQNMTFDGYENCGLKSKRGSTLFYEIYRIYEYELKNLGHFGYNIGKVFDIFTTNSFEKSRIRRLLEEAKDEVNRYVKFTNNESEDETYILIQMAEYFDALESNCCLNKNIPNSLDYRLHILNQDEIKMLNLDND